MSETASAPAAPAAGSRARLRDRIEAGLFPAPEPPGGRLSRLEAGIVIAALLALGTVLSLLRLGTDALETVWAEDAPIYLQAALTHGFFEAVLEPYAGYLVLGPRLIAELATVVPLQDAPAAIAVVSAFVAALSGLAVWHGSAGHLRDPYLRAALAVATVLAATAGQETLDSAAYAPWFMLAGAFWLLFLRPRSWWGACLAGAFLLLTGLSTPGVWYFLPVAALRAFCSWRDGRAAIVLGSWLLGGLVQIPVILGQEQIEATWSRHIWTGLVQRVIDGGIFGQRLGGNLWSHFGWTFLVVLLVAVAVGLLVGLMRTRASSRWFVAVAIPTSFAMFVASVYQRAIGDSIFWSPGESGGAASRYVLVPALLFLAALLVTLDGVVRPGRERTPPRWSRGAVAAAVGVVLVAVAVSFDMRAPVRQEPFWEEAIEAAADKCVANGEADAGIATSLPTFGVILPCSQVESFAAPALRERHR